MARIVSTVNGVGGVKCAVTGFSPVRVVVAGSGDGLAALVDPDTPTFQKCNCLFINTNNATSL